MVVGAIDEPDFFLALEFGGGQSITSSLFLKPGMELPFGLDRLYFCQPGLAFFMASLRESLCFSAYSVTN